MNTVPITPKEVFERQHTEANCTLFLHNRYGKLLSALTAAEDYVTLNELNRLLNKEPILRATT